MTKAIRSFAEADDEISHAIDRYGREREGLGAEFWNELKAAMRTLEAPGPECGHVIGLPRELGVCRKLLVRFPYAIRQPGGGIEVTDGDDEHDENNDGHGDDNDPGRRRNNLAHLIESTTLAVTAAQYANSQMEAKINRYGAESDRPGEPHQLGPAPGRCPRARGPRRRWSAATSRRRRLRSPGRRAAARGLARDVAEALHFVEPRTRQPRGARACAGAAL